MIVLCKYLIPLIILILSEFLVDLVQAQNSKQIIATAYSINGTSSNQNKPLILENKYNIGHKTRNKRIRFPDSNIEGCTDNLCLQVFVKKEMTKSRKLISPTKNFGHYSSDLPS